MPTTTPRLHACTTAGCTIRTAERICHRCRRYGHHEPLNRSDRAQPCSTEGCERATFRDKCHYCLRSRRPRRDCAADGCGFTTSAEDGFCHQHRPSAAGTAPCTRPGCTRAAGQDGICSRCALYTPCSVCGHRACRDVCGRCRQTSRRNPAREIPEVFPQEERASCGDLAAELGVGVDLPFDNSDLLELEKEIEADRALVIAIEAVLVRAGVVPSAALVDEILKLVPHRA